MLGSTCPSRYRGRCGLKLLADCLKDLTKLVDIWMVNLRPEENFWWHHRVVLGEEKFSLEHATLVDRFGRTSNLYEEVSAVSLRRFGINSDDWFLGKSLSFLVLR